MGEKKRRQSTGGSGWGGDGLRRYRVDAPPADAFGGDPRLQGMAGGILEAVLNTAELHQPVYRSDIKTEAQADAAPDLPLVYIWNENLVRGSFSVSVNGRVIGAILERQLPRTDAAFTEVRDYILDAVRRASRDSVVATCQRRRCGPSKIFSLTAGEPGPMTA